SPLKKTNQTDTTTTTGNNGGRTAQNLKPAEKPDPTHGGGQGPAKQPINKNRYQQTWHTIEFSNNRHTGTTQTTTVQDRSGATFQTYPNRRPKANPRLRKPPAHRGSPPVQSTPISAPFSGRLSRGSVAIFPL